MHCWQNETFMLVKVHVYLKYDICASTLFHLVTTEFKKCPWLMFTKYFLYLHIISEILLFDAFLPRNTWILIFLPSLTTFGLYFRTKFHLDNIFNNIFGFKPIISLLDFYCPIYSIFFSLFFLSFPLIN